MPDFPTVVDVLAKNAPKGKAGRKKAGAELVPRGTNLGRHANQTKPVLQAKLAEKHPVVWSEFLAGKFTSVRAAAAAEPAPRVLALARPRGTVRVARVRTLREGRGT